MAACGPRIDAYAKALRAAIRPGSTVLDIGSGPGIFAVLACRLGAARAAAIDPDPSVELARELADANGFADRIDVFRGVSTEYHPNAKADVIVSDIRGNLPFLQGHIEAIVDARERLLAPGGKLIPMADHLYIAAIESEDHHARIARPWLENDLDLDLSAGFGFAANSATKTWFEGTNLLSEPVCLATLDYSTIASPSLTAEFRLPISRSGTVHGLAVWFDSDLANGIAFSNAPASPKLIYGQIFLPFDAPVALGVGEAVEGRFSATLTGNDYVYSWSGTVGDLRAEFHQSTFRSRIYAPADLQMASGSRVPERSDELDLDAFILAKVNGTNSIDDIAASSFERFRACVPTPEAAMDRVLKLINRYGREDTRQ